MKKDLKKLVKELERQGYEVRVLANGHVQVRRDGRVISALSGTPSDRRAWLNQLAPLKRDGFRWPR